MSLTRSKIVHSLGLPSIGLLGLVSTFACVGQHPIILACPCAPGWSCDTAKDVCVQNDSPDTGATAGDGGQVDEGGPAGGNVAGAGGTGGFAGASDVSGFPGTGGGGPVIVDTSYPDACQALVPPPDATDGQPVAGCPCTRGPGPGNSQQCTQGANAVISQLIGPEGGTITLMGQQGTSSGVAFELVVPPGALKTAVTLSVTETDLSPPSAYTDYSPVYRVAPLGTAFTKLAIVHVPYGGNNGVIPNDLSIYQSQPSMPCAFQSLPDHYINAGFLTGSLTTTGYLFAGLPKANDACP